MAETITFGRADGNYITLEQYDIISAFLPFFGTGRPVDMKYDREKGRIVITDEEPDKIRKILSERGYKELK